MGAGPEQEFERLTLEQEILLDQVEGIERELQLSVERLDVLTRDLARINDALTAIDEQLAAAGERLGAT